MFRNRRKPVELVVQRPIAEPPARMGHTELDMLHLAFWTHSLRPAGQRDTDLIDKILDERNALVRSMVPVIPGRGHHG